MRSNIWKFYVFEMLRRAAFFVPVIVLFWQENGLSLTQVMVLQSLFAIAVVLFEVPTGYFADCIGRAFSLLLGSIVTTAAFTLYSVSSSFWWFLAAETFAAFGLSLVSGANAALLYDTLLALGEEDRYKRIFGHALFLGLLVLAVSNVLGGLLATVSYRLTLIVCIPFLAASIPVAWSFKEPPMHKHVVERGYVRDALKVISQTVRERVKLRWLIVFAAVTFGFYQSVLWLYQPYFALSGLDVVFFGAIFASFQVVAGLSAKYAYRLEELFGERFSLLFITVVLGASYLFMSRFVFVLSFVFAFVQQVVRGFYKTIISEYLNRLTPSRIRATVHSVESMFAQLVYAGIIPFLGVLADVYSVPQALFVLGVSSLVVGGVALAFLWSSGFFQALALNSHLHPKVEQ